MLSSHAKLRAEVVPCPDAADAADIEMGQARQLELTFAPGQGSPADEHDGAPLPRRPWAWLLRHVFQADLEHCPRCDGPMRWVHAATTPKDIARLLAQHGLGPRPPPSPTPPPPGQLRFAFPLSS